MYWIWSLSINAILTDNKLEYRLCLIVLSASERNNCFSEAQNYTKLTFVIQSYYTDDMEIYKNILFQVNSRNMTLICIYVCTLKD